MTASNAGLEPVQRLLAHQAIGEALVRHSRGIDRMEAALIRGAYHEDATVDYGFFKGAAHELAGMLTAWSPDSPVTLHRSAPAWIAIDGDAACSETYVIAYTQTPEEQGSQQRVIGGRYLDRHDCRDGGWRLSHRHYVMDWNINLAGASLWPEPGTPLANGFPRGAHGDRDPGRALLTLGWARMQCGATPSESKSGERAMVMDQEEQLDRALAKIDIHELLMAYARGVDRADRELLASVFHPDATVISGVFNGNAQDFAREITSHVKANLARCFHSIANEWVDVQGDRAIGEAYVIATMTAGDTDTLTGGRYIGEYERRDGVWKIASHTFVADWNMNLPTSYQTDGMYASLDSRGCFGKEDPVYGLWP